PTSVSSKCSMETRVDKCSGEEHRDTRCMSRGAQASSVTCSKVQARYCLGIRSKNPRRPEGRGGMIKLQPQKVGKNGQNNTGRTSFSRTHGGSGGRAAS